MYISTIKISNFRVYEGTHSLFFDKNKRNINIIVGNNGYGKTTFINALLWCLYGKYIVDVDEAYRKEVFDAGGYGKYAKSNLNNRSLEQGIKNHEKIKVEGNGLLESGEDIIKPYTYSVSISIENVQIPSIPFSNLKIIRSYSVANEKEELKILIDEKQNELTKEIGNQVFINDFILPKEIAKFFFFDAEKIVSLAEMTTITDKRKISKAYSEVLGLKKYENLIQNLKSLKSRLRISVASEDQINKLNQIKSNIETNESILEFNRGKISLCDSQINEKRRLIDDFQSQLIREGSNLSVNDINELREKREELKKEYEILKNSFKDIIDFVPFAIMTGQLKLVQERLKSETSAGLNIFKIENLKNLESKILSEIKSKSDTLNLQSESYDSIVEIIKQSLNDHLNPYKSSKTETLLDFSNHEINQFHALVDYLKKSFKERFKEVSDSIKRNRTAVGNISKRIENAEAILDNDYILRIRKEKEELSDEIALLEAESRKLFEEIGRISNENAIKQKRVSELEKKIALDTTDREKDAAIDNTLKKLNRFISSYKTEKKQLLESSIISGINELMHKENFIKNVEVQIKEDLIDINLFDFKGRLIQKDSLSKGEKQLYATAILKSLINETDIKFPIFVDSPFQKFDSIHSTNIISGFYPSIDRQVFLLPLLEKEMTYKEYKLIKPYIQKTFILSNENNSSKILEVKDPSAFSNLFSLVE